jgi:hypothetical protein
MASIYQYTLADGSRRYGVRWRDHGGRQHFRLAGSRRKDALTLKHDIERRLRMGPLFDEPTETFAFSKGGWSGTASACGQRPFAATARFCRTSFRWLSASSIDFALRASRISSSRSDASRRGRRSSPCGSSR